MADTHATTIRVTKLYVPQPPVATVARPRLTHRFDAALAGSLTLVSAPAGFGKTTAVAEWVGHLRATGGPAVAWLSLDEADSDPARFLAYLIAAVRTAFPQAGAAALDLLAADPTATVEPVLTALLNDLAALDKRLVLVLDDYHVIDSAPVDEVLTLLLDELPARLHLVITAREDPALPLARLRARGQLTEVRAADLRFSAREAAEFLSGTMGLPLTAEDAARLEERTEGWIAGLQLAALSLRGRSDSAAFIDSFAGSHRFVLDYLVEEVLDNQTAAVRAFLLRTSILERLSGPLCDAVTLATDGQETLGELEHANLFVVPLDDQRRWYRYHHLFADVLRAYARSELAEELPELHRRACDWHEKHGSLADAIGHALAVPDLEHAADLIEANSHEMRRTRRGPTLLKWIEALPPATVAGRPLLSVALAATLLDSGRLEAVESHLAAAERWLEVARESLPDGSAAQLAGLIAMHRAGLALVSGDPTGAEQHARTALTVAPEDDLAARGGALGLVGLALWSGGELEQAHDAFEEGMEMLRGGGFVADSIGGVATLAGIRLAQGRLNEAVTALEEALVGSARLAGADPRGALGLHVALAEALYERDDLAGAEQHLQAARELGERSGWAQSRSRWCTVTALVSLARGDAAEAASMVEQAGHFHTHGFDPDLRPVAAVRARIDVAGGRIQQALAWARESAVLGAGGIDPAALSYLREYEHISVARVLLASHGLEVSAGAPLATELLELLLAAAVVGDRGRSVIEVLVLLAVARQLAGDEAGARQALERAVSLAEPPGIVRMFVDELPALEGLLRSLGEESGSARLARFCRELLTHTGTGAQETRPRDTRSAGTRPLDTDARSPDSITDRELEVLRLIAAGLSNHQIAQRLFRAESTIKGVNRVLFEKLGVQSRTEAIARARELGLLP